MFPVPNIPLVLRRLQEWQSQLGGRLVIGSRRHLSDTELVASTNALARDFSALMGSIDPEERLCWDACLSGAGGISRLRPERRLAARWR